MEMYLSELKCSFAFCKHQQLFLFNRLDSGVIENAAKPIKNNSVGVFKLTEFSKFTGTLCLCCCSKHI